MTDKVTLSNIVTFQNDTTAATLINNNNAAITTAIDNTLSRDGTSPNQMLASLDMNSNRIINLPAPVNATDPVRLEDLSAPIPSTGTSLALSGTLGVSGATSLAGLTTTGNTSVGGNLAVTGTSSFTGASTFKAGPWNDVTAYGADPTGIADSTTAIQNAINALPAAGGIVFFPTGNYSISSTINIGNGSSSSGSTKQGVVLLGAGNPSTPFGFGGFMAGTPRLTWNGGASTVISVNGPLQGWGIQNLYINARSVANIGIFVQSAQYGDSRNLVLDGCRNQGIYSTVVAPFGAFAETDSLHNNWQNISVNMAGVVESIGILLTGLTSANTDYNRFDNVTIALPSLVCYGVFLQACDSNTFNGLHMFGSSSSAVGINFDYSINNTQPAANIIIGYDPGSVISAFGGGGAGAGARGNYVIGLQESNGAKNPNVANIYPDLPILMGPSIDLVGQTASIGVNGISAGPTGVPYLTGMYRLNYYLLVTNTGVGGATLTATLTWVDDSSQTQSFTTPSLATNAKNFAQGSLPIRCLAGQNLTYSTTVTGSIGSAQYALHIKVEKMD